MLCQKLRDSKRVTGASEIVTDGTPRLDWPGTLGQEILIVALADIEVHGELETADAAANGGRTGMTAGGVPYKPYAWFGRLRNAQSQAYSRATMRLEQEGYVTRLTESGRNRVTHIRLTPKGLNFALGAAKNCDRKLVETGLRRTKWGARLAEQVFGPQPSPDSPAA